MLSLIVSVPAVTKLRLSGCLPEVSPNLTVTDCAVFRLQRHHTSEPRCAGGMAASHGGVLAKPIQCPSGGNAGEGSAETCPGEFGDGDWV